MSARLKVAIAIASKLLGKMQQKLTKELAEKLKKMEGEVRGVVFKTDLEFVLKEKGKEGLKKLKEKLKEIGCEIDYEKINPMGFYPLGLRIISLLAIKEVFNFNEEKIKEMGSSAPKLSLLIKLFVKFFFSIQKTAVQVPEIWKKHYTIGNLEVEVNEEKRYVILRLKDFLGHPIFCVYLEGYFSTISQIVVNQPVTSQETKCPFKGGDFHEYLIRW